MKSMIDNLEFVADALEFAGADCIVNLGHNADATCDQLQSLGGVRKDLFLESENKWFHTVELSVGCATFIAYSSRHENQCGTEAAE